MRYQTEPDPQWKCLKQIQALVQSQIRPEARVTLKNYFLSKTPRDSYCGFIGFDWSSDMKLNQIAHTPGIPMEALIPEKALPIAQWIVRQMRKEYPEWFID